MNKFDVVLADPPWIFKTWSDKGKDRSPEKHYQTMTIDDICNLPVKEVTSKNSALFLWVTWPTIFKFAPMVFEAWDYEYRARAFTWVKANKHGVYNLIEKMRGMLESKIDVYEVDRFMQFGFWHMGNGYYTRANDEVCLLGIRGKMPVADRGVRSLIAEARRDHSRKPEGQYKRIEALFPDRHYIELFARNTRPGWVSLGNDIDGKDIRNSLKEIKESINGKANDQKSN